MTLNGWNALLQKQNVLWSPPKGHHRNLNEDRPIMSAAKCRPMIPFSRNIRYIGYTVMGFLGDQGAVVQEDSFCRFNWLFVRKLLERISGIYIQDIQPLDCFSVWGLRKCCITASISQQTVIIIIINLQMHDLEWPWITILLGFFWQ